MITGNEFIGDNTDLTSGMLEQPSKNIENLGDQQEYKRILEFPIKEVKEHMQDKTQNVLQNERKNIELSDGHYLETKSLISVTESEIDRIVMNYREDFGYGWEEYKKCPIEGCECIVSIQDYFELEDKTYIPLEELESTHPNKGKIVKCNKDHPAENLVDFWDFETSKIDIKNKFQQEGNIVLLKDSKNTIVGYMWGYTAEFHTAYKYEFDKFYGHHPEIYNKYFAGLSQRLGKNFTDRSLVYVKNILGITKGHRKFEYILELQKALLRSATPDQLELPTIAEANTQTSYYCYALLMEPEIITFGLKDHNVLMLSARKLKNMKKYWDMSTEVFHEKFSAKLEYYRELQSSNWMKK